MLYNKSQFRKINDKKLLHKIGKKWVTISALTLALLGSSMTLSKVTTHADTTPNTDSKKKNTQNNNKQVLETPITSTTQTDKTSTPATTLKGIQNSAKKLATNLISNAAHRLFGNAEFQEEHTTKSDNHSQYMYKNDNESNQDSNNSSSYEVSASISAAAVANVSSSTGPVSAQSNVTSEQTPVSSYGINVSNANSTESTENYTFHITVNRYLNSSITSSTFSDTISNANIGSSYVIDPNYYSNIRSYTSGYFPSYSSDPDVYNNIIQVEPNNVFSPSTNQVHDIVSNYDAISQYNLHYVNVMNNTPISSETIPEPSSDYDHYLDSHPASPSILPSGEAIAASAMQSAYVNGYWVKVLPSFSSYYYEHSDSDSLPLNLPRASTRDKEIKMVPKYLKNVPFTVTVYKQLNNSITASSFLKSLSSASEYTEYTIDPNMYSDIRSYTSGYLMPKYYSPDSYSDVTNNSYIYVDVTPSDAPHDIEATGTKSKPTNSGNDYVVDYARRSTLTLNFVNVKDHNSVVSSKTFEEPNSDLGFDYYKLDSSPASVSSSALTQPTYPSVKSYYVYGSESTESFEPNAHDIINTISDEEDSSGYSYSVTAPSGYDFLGSSATNSEYYFTYKYPKSESFTSNVNVVPNHVGNVPFTVIVKRHFDGSVTSSSFSESLSNAYQYANYVIDPNYYGDIRSYTSASSYYLLSNSDIDIRITPSDIQINGIKSTPTNSCATVDYDKLGTLTLNYIDKKTNKLILSKQITQENPNSDNTPANPSSSWTTYHPVSDHNDHWRSDATSASCESSTAKAHMYRYTLIPGYHFLNSNSDNDSDASDVTPASLTSKNVYMEPNSESETVHYVYSDPSDDYGYSLPRNQIILGGYYNESSAITSANASGLGDNWELVSSSTPFVFNDPYDYSYGNHGYATIYDSNKNTTNVNIKPKPLQIVTVQYEDQDGSLLGPVNESLTIPSGASVGQNATLSASTIKDHQPKGYTYHGDNMTVQLQPFYKQPNLIYVTVDKNVVIPDYVSYEYKAPNDHVYNASELSANAAFPTNTNFNGINNINPGSNWTINNYSQTLFDARDHPYIKVEITPKPCKTININYTLHGAGSTVISVGHTSMQLPNSDLNKAVGSQISIKKDALPNVPSGYVPTDDVPVTLKPFFDGSQTIIVPVVLQHMTSYGTISYSSLIAVAEHKNSQASKYALNDKSDFNSGVLTRQSNNDISEFKSISSFAHQIDTYSSLLSSETQTNPLTASDSNAAETDYHIASYDVKSISSIVSSMTDIEPVPSYSSVNYNVTSARSKSNTAASYASNDTSDINALGLNEQSRTDNSYYSNIIKYDKSGSGYNNAVNSEEIKAISATKANNSQETSTYDSYAASYHTLALAASASIQSLTNKMTDVRPIPGLKSVSTNMTFASTKTSLAEEYASNDNYDANVSVLNTQAKTDSIDSKEITNYASQISSDNSNVTKLESTASIYTSIAASDETMTNASNRYKDTSQASGSTNSAMSSAELYHYYALKASSAIQALTDEITDKFTPSYSPINVDMSGATSINSVASSYASLLNTDNHSILSAQASNDSRVYSQISSLAYAINLDNSTVSSADSTASSAAQLDQAMSAYINDAALAHKYASSAASLIAALTKHSITDRITPNYSQLSINTNNASSINSIAASYAASANNDENSSAITHQRSFDSRTYSCISSLSRLISQDNMVIASANNAANSLANANESTTDEVNVAAKAYDSALSYASTIQSLTNKMTDIMPLIISSSTKSGSSSNNSASSSSKKASSCVSSSAKNSNQDSSVNKSSSNKSTASSGTSAASSNNSQSIASDSSSKSNSSTSANSNSQSKASSSSASQDANSKSSQALPASSQSESAGSSTIPGSSNSGSTSQSGSSVNISTKSTASGATTTNSAASKSSSKLSNSGSDKGSSSDSSATSSIRPKGAGSNSSVSSNSASRNSSNSSAHNGDTSSALNSNVSYAYSSDSAVKRNSSAINAPANSSSSSAHSSAASSNDSPSAVSSSSSNSSNSTSANSSSQYKASSSSASQGSSSKFSQTSSISSHGTSTGSSVVPSSDKSGLPVSSTNSITPTRGDKSGNTNSNSGQSESHQSAAKPSNETTPVNSKGKTMIPASKTNSTTNKTGNNSESSTKNGSTSNSRSKSHNNKLNTSTSKSDYPSTPGKNGNKGTASVDPSNKDSKGTHSASSNLNKSTSNTKPNQSGNNTTTKPTTPINPVKPSNNSTKPNGSTTVTPSGKTPVTPVSQRGDSSNTTPASNTDYGSSSNNMNSSDTGFMNTITPTNDFTAATATTPVNGQTPIVGHKSSMLAANHDMMHSTISHRASLPLSNHNKATNKLNVGKVTYAHGFKITRLRLPSHFRYFWIVKTCLAHQNMTSFGNVKDYDKVLQPRDHYTFRINKFFKIQKNGKTMYRYEIRAKFGNRARNYFVTGNWHFTRNAYIQPHELRRVHGVFGHYYYKARLILGAREYTKTCYNDKTFVRNLHKGKVLHIKRVVSIGHKGYYQTRFQLTNGHYVTANRNFVKLIK